MAKDHASLLLPIRQGRYVAREAVGADVTRAQRLRHRCFVEQAGRAALPGLLESDAFDALSTHVIVEDAGGDVVACFRTMSWESGSGIAESYSAQFYDLKAVQAWTGPVMELGRFCVAPEVQNADVLRLAWGALAALVDGQGVGLLFGCSSFVGTDDGPYRAALNLLTQRHMAPDAWRPGVKAAEVVRFAESPVAPVDRASALKQIPPLLRTYLAMGGWVSDHAVIDRDMNTLHVFTGLEIATIPAARAKALRAVAAGG